jgi:hypothetical protein
MRLLTVAPKTRRKLRALDSHRSLLLGNERRCFGGSQGEAELVKGLRKFI